MSPGADLIADRAPVGLYGPRRTWTRHQASTGACPGHWAWAWTLAAADTSNPGYSRPLRSLEAPGSVNSFALRSERPRISVDVEDFSVTRPPPNNGDLSSGLRGPMAVRASRVLLWVLLVLGAGGGLIAGVRRTPTTRSATGRALEAPPARVTGFAGLAVRSWLTTVDTGHVGSEPTLVTPRSSTLGGC